MMLSSALIASVLNFSVVVFILVYFGRKPFAQFLVSRSETLKTTMAEAQKLAVEANAELLKWEQNWKATAKHASENRTAAQDSLKRFKEKTLIDAEAEADRIKKESELFWPHSVRTQVSKNISGRWRKQNAPPMLRRSNTIIYRRGTSIRFSLRHRRSM